MTDEELRRRLDSTYAAFDRVTGLLGRDGGAALAAARRERERQLRALTRRLAAIGVVVGGLSLAVIAIGLVRPIGMFGFLAAVGLAIGVAALLAFWPRRGQAVAPLPADLPARQLVQRFDSLLARARPALPAPARAEIDSITPRLPALEQALARPGGPDPLAADARRLMERHLPELIERYRAVPAAYRGALDGEGLSVDERLVEGLRAGREALDEIGDNLARTEVARLETQGRFIRSRYRDGAPS